MTKKTKDHSRAAGNTTLTFPLPVELKESLKARASGTRAQLAVADLVRLAIQYQEERNWKDLPECAAVMN